MACVEQIVVRNLSLIVGLIKGSVTDEVDEARIVNKLVKILNSRPESLLLPGYENKLYRQSLVVRK